MGSMATGFSHQERKFRAEEARACSVMGRKQQRENRRGQGWGETKGDMPGKVLAGPLVGQCTLGSVQDRIHINPCRGRCSHRGQQGRCFSGPRWAGHPSCLKLH